MTTQPTPDDSAHLAETVALLSAALVQAFTQAERDLIAGVAQDARVGLAAAPGSAARLGMLRAMQVTAARIANLLGARIRPLVNDTVREAIRRGDQQALRTLTTVTASHPSLLLQLTRQQPEPVTPLALATANRIQIDLLSRLTDAQLRITRYPRDAYQAAVARAAQNEILSGKSPAAAQRDAWDDLTARGVTGLTDTRGRQWNLASYVEMATRTAVQRAYNQAHMDRMLAAGIERFTIAPHAHPCPLCQPWEGRVLTADEVDVARGAGLFHPNCTHTVVAYFAGITRIPEAGRWTEADQRRYAATQRLRMLERQVRAAKLQEAGALNDLDRARARRRARAAQAAIREHLQSHPTLLRRRRREQLDLGNS